MSCSRRQHTDAAGFDTSIAVSKCHPSHMTTMLQDEACAYCFSMLFWIMCIYYATFSLFPYFINTVYFIQTSLCLAFLRLYLRLSHAFLVVHLCAVTTCMFMKVHELSREIAYKNKHYCLSSSRKLTVSIYTSVKLDIKICILWFHF